MNRSQPRARLPLLTLTLAVVLGAVAAPAARAQDGMGRLFFSPAQRAQLDTARQRNVRAPIAGEQPEEAQPLPQEVTVNGMIRRNDGRTTVWLNNKMVAPDAQSVAGSVEVRPRRDGSVTLALPQSGRSVDLKVGQSVEALSGQIEDVYRRRTLTAPGPENKPAPTPPPAGTVEKVTPAAPGAPQTAAKGTETVEPKRKKDDGPPWDMLQYSTK